MAWPGLLIGVLCRELGENRPINALRCSQPGCDNCDVSSSQHFADLQPATERIGLTERLDEERRAILAQIRDLTPDDIHARPLPSTDLSIGRIAKHLAFTEDRWFQHKLLGLDLPEPWRSVTDTGGKTKRAPVLVRHQVRGYEATPGIEPGYRALQALASATRPRRQRHSRNCSPVTLPAKPVDHPASR